MSLFYPLLLAICCTEVFLFMQIWEIIGIAIGLSMDAFAVSVCKGMSVKDVKLSHMMIAGLYFGGFQALMPFLGYLLGEQFESLITSIDHWIAFVLLCIIGINMIREAVSKKEEQLNNSFGFKAMIVLAIATSIDALAVGITFAFLQVDILTAILIIGITTFILSAIGVKIGNAFGSKFKKKAELFGGIVLILIGTKILLEHLGVFG